MSSRRVEQPILEFNQDTINDQAIGSDPPILTPIPPRNQGSEQSLDYLYTVASHIGVNDPAGSVVAQTPDTPDSFVKCGDHRITEP